MQNTPTVSTNKIIVFIVFICAAIMTSLFVFHWRKSPAQPVLPPEIGMAFTVPRDIKSFTLVSTNNRSFSQKNFYGHWTLLFFGFTHCSSICPTTLDIMNHAYNKLLNRHLNLQVVLVSIDPERDTLESLAKYTQSYNPNFIGVTGKIQELRKLQSQLGIFSGRDTTATNENYQIQHTSSIMLINPQGKWVGLFNYGLKPDQLAKAIGDSINLSRLLK